MCLAYLCLFVCVCVLFLNSSMFLVDLMYFYVFCIVSVTALYQLIRHCVAC